MKTYSRLTTISLLFAATFLGWKSMPEEDHEERIRQLESEVFRLETELKKVYALLGILRENERSIAFLRLPTAKSKGPTRDFHWRVHFPSREFCPKGFRLVVKTGKLDIKGVLQDEQVSTEGISVASGESSLDAAVRCYWDSEKISFCVDSEVMTHSATVDTNAERFGLLKKPQSAKAPGLVQHYEGQLLGSPVYEKDDNGTMLLQLDGIPEAENQPNCVQLWIIRSE